MILESKEDIIRFKTKDTLLKTEPTIVSGQETIDVRDKMQDPNVENAQIENAGIIKRFIPYYIYKPPFGYPRRDIDLLNCRRLAKTPFVFSVIKTLLDEICSAKWDIVPNEDIEEEQVKDKIKNVKDFFNNPNGNDESFRHVLRAVCRDVFELDAGVIEKVYNLKGEITQLFPVDGSTILKNPDEHGYMGNREDYIPVSEYPTMDSQEQVRHYYTQYYKERAAYFQYNWTGGIWPVPFGKREIIYIKANDQSDSIYGTSPVQVLYNVVLILLYASQTNLDMYANNNLPTGILSMEDANKSQMEATRNYFNTLTTERDVYGHNRKKFFNIPISPKEVKYVDFKISAKDMQMIEQQKWYQDVVYKAFGVTPSEMGESVGGRAEGNEQSRIFKRKALAPIFKLLEYHFNTQLVWELDPQKQVCFKFDDYDVESEFRKAELNEKLLNTTWSVNEIRVKDNMKPLDGEENDKLKSQSMAGQMGGFGQGFGSQDSMNSQGDKDDVSNNERSPEKEDKLFEKPKEDDTEKLTKKSLEEDVPKKTELEKTLIDNYKSIEKRIIELVN